MNILFAGVMVVWLSAGATAVSVSETPPPESKRLASAKDFIAEEQWMRAIEVLNGMLHDAKETGKDEALYWLAHSLNQSGDAAGALSTIRRLESQYPASLWVKPAGAVRLEIAVRLRRFDVLWLTATPPPPPPPPYVPAKAPQPPAVGSVKPAPPRLPAPGTEPPVPAPRAPRPSVIAAAVPVWSAPASYWFPEIYQPDPDLRVQALGHLMRTDAHKAIPILKEICFETNNLDSANRAVFVLAQSQSAEAHNTVVEVAKLGPKHVRVAAVRELGRFGGKDASDVLVTVYPTGDLAVKLQVVKSLGERSERSALLKIAQSEVDSDLRIRAILTLGKAGGAPELRTLYSKWGAEFKRPILRGLGNARAEHELIYIAGVERDQALLQEVLTQLRLLGTPKAKDYLQKVSGNK